MDLTESPADLLRWMIAVPEMARLIAEFECEGDSNKDILPHHEQAHRSRFSKDTLSLLNTIKEPGKPLQEDRFDIFIH